MSECMTSYEVHETLLYYCTPVLDASDPGHLCGKRIINKLL